LSPAHQALLPLPLVLPASSVVLLLNGSSVWLPPSDRVPFASRSQELYCGCIAVVWHDLFSGFKCGWGELEVGLYHTVADAAGRLYRMTGWFTVTTYPLLISYNTWTQLPLDFTYFLSVSDWTFCNRPRIVELCSRHS
jgi:hypothetical protein